MQLTTGTRLGPYEILALIGSGGMGEVYKARDTRLDRVVAVKVSQEQFNERFDREARAISALNHPHICTLYDVGPNYLVMEYIEGQPLTRPLPTDQALRYGAQICDALGAAHGKGVTHRDLKPGNILVTKSGVKLLDFGLAKIAPVARAEDTTQTLPLTEAGLVFGTLQYMSPEQVQGKEAGPASDIFSFGLVLYEMLAGRRAFQASTQAGLIAEILKEDPPALASIPSALERVVKRCLAKDPENRWQSARDLKAELEWIATEGFGESTVVSRRSILPWMAGAAVVGAAGATALAKWAPWPLGDKRSSVASGGITRFRLTAPEGVRIQRNFTRQSLALSPVGRRVAMIGENQNGFMIWVQGFDSLTANPLAGTEGASMVFWSPDGQFLGFWAGGKLMKIPAEGGTALPICDVPPVWAASWNQDGVIVAQTSAITAASISVSSGSVRPTRKLFAWPKFLPDGKHVLHWDQSRSRGYVEDLSAGTETELMASDTQLIFVPDEVGGSQGYLLYGRSGNLLAHRFDAAALRVSGEPVPVAKEVPFFLAGWAEFDASSGGALIYSTGSQRTRMTWVDRGGRELGTVGEPKDFFGFLRLSPDGSKLAADVFDSRSGNTDIWVYNLAQGATSERATFEDGGEYTPVWSPDGKRIAYGSGLKAVTGVRLKFKSINERGEAEGFADGFFQFPSDWSADGRWIFYATSGGDSKGDLWAASVTERKVFPLMQTSFDSAFPALSPAENYLAYAADDGGRHEIYVQRFEGGNSPKVTGERLRVSQDGGNNPRWRPDGKELFFVSPERRVMAVAVSPGTGIPSGPATALFPLPGSYRSLAPWTAAYDVTRDGQRFLVFTRDSAGSVLEVAINWQLELKV